ncbi:MAG: hypothetical protein ACREP9_04750, partial [Candidatus Dormibacteraceae bacterium]
MNRTWHYYWPGVDARGASKLRFHGGWSSAIHAGGSVNNPRSFQFKTIQCLFAAALALAPLLTPAATLDTYGELMGKTVLAPSVLLSSPGLIVAELPSDKASAIALFESEFSKKGISVVPDGPSFVRLFPSGDWQAGLSNAPLRGAQLRAASSQPLMPAGAVNFPRTELG